MARGSPVTRRRRLSIILLVTATLALLAAPTIARNNLGIGLTTVLTGSMRPQINPGDLVMTRASSASTLGVGDVVVVQSGNEQVAHRIVEIRPLSGLERITTKGDANALIDTDPVMVSPTEEVPRIVWRLPGIGSPLAFLASPTAQRLAITLLVGANLLVLTLFVTRRRPGFENEEGRPQENSSTRPNPASVDA